MSIASTRPPDAARLPHLQQLARGADRRLLIGSATLAVAGLALALRGPQVVAAACMAAAALPARWLAGPLAGRSIARNGLAVLVAL
ncbi:chemotaxis protein, partial [Stenotrophomonas sp. SG1]|nr:chemotaxis protein [Stenotrophomonas sp. SG1]